MDEQVNRSGEGAASHSTDLGPRERALLTAFGPVIFPSAPALLAQLVASQRARAHLSGRATGDQPAQQASGSRPILDSAPR